MTTYTGAAYEMVMQQVISANVIIAAKALNIARQPVSEVETAITQQLEAWRGTEKALAQSLEVERSLRALVVYFQGANS